MASAWDIRERNKVATCILHVDNVTFHWALNLRRMKIPGPEPVGVAGMPFDHARNHCAMHALNSGAEWLFFLDSDVMPPADAVPRLLSWGRPVISGMYCRRSPPHAVPVMMRNNQWVTDLPKDPRNPLCEVELVGAGCLLIHRTVLQKLPPHRPGKPWFDWRVDMAGHVPAGEALSEDYSFCLAVRKYLGIPIMVDTSVRCKHVGFAEADFGTFLPIGSNQVA